MGPVLTPKRAQLVTDLAKELKQNRLHTLDTIRPKLRVFVIHP